MVKRALDSGAHGIVVPLLHTPEDAQKLVASAKFPPVGQRGYGSPFPMGMFDIEGNLSQLDYLKSANQNLVTIVQIETKEALANVDAIAQVEGIDVLFVGPYDLGNNIGHPVTGDFDPELKTAIAKVQKAAKKAGKVSGIYAISGEQARSYADQGFQMVCCSTTVFAFADVRQKISVIADMVALPTALGQALNKAKGSYGHAAMNAVKGAAYGTANLVSNSPKEESS